MFLPKHCVFQIQIFKVINLYRDGRFTTRDPQEPDPCAGKAAHGTGPFQRLAEGLERSSIANPGPSARRVLQGKFFSWHFFPPVLFLKTHSIPPWMWLMLWCTPTFTDQIFLRPFFASFTDNFLARLFRCSHCKKFEKLHVRKSIAQDCMQVSQIFAMATSK